MIQITEELARVAAQDAANASAKPHGGPPWTIEDYHVFCQTYERLWPDRFVDNPNRTLADHAEAWWRATHDAAPARGSEAWESMYEKWIDFAFGKGE